MPFSVTDRKTKNEPGVEWGEKNKEERALVALSCAVASVCLPFPFAWTSWEFLSSSPPLTFFFFLPCQGSNLEPLLVPDVSSLPQKYSPTFTVFTDYFVCWFTHSFIHPHVCWGGHVYHSMLMEVGGPLHEINSLLLLSYACVHSADWIWTTRVAQQTPCAWWAISWPLSVYTPLLFISFS